MKTKPNTNNNIPIAKFFNCTENKPNVRFHKCISVCKYDECVIHFFNSKIKHKHFFPSKHDDIEHIVII